MKRVTVFAALDVKLMLVIGGTGLVVNIVGVVVLGGHREEGMNIEGAFLHVFVDLCGSVAVIVAALVMRFIGFVWVDTVASLIIGALILPRAVALLRQAAGVLLERVPRGVDVAKLRSDLQELTGVVGVHDLHVWSLDGEDLLATCHLVIRDAPVSCVMLDRAQEVFERAGIGHSTIQVEAGGHAVHEQVCEH